MGINLNIMKKKKPRIFFVFLSSYIAFFIIIFISLWGLEIIMLNSLYTKNAKEDLIRVTNSIAKVYVDSNKDINSTNGILVDNDKLNLVIYRYDEEGIIIEKNTNNNLTKELETLLNEAKIEILLENSFFEFNSNDMTYGISKTIDKTTYFFVATQPVAEIRSAQKVIKQVLTTVTCVAFAVALFLAYFISLLISRPIVKLSNSAKKLAEGDFENVFPSNNFKEISQLGESLNYASYELKKASHLQRELIANISHDLKTPLTLIKSYAEMIRDFSGFDEVKREEHLSTIIDETDRLTLLVNDILTLSKAQAEVQQNYVEINLSDIILSSLMNISALVDKAKLELNCDIEEGVFIHGDKKQIEEVVYNFLSNAIGHAYNEVTVILSFNKRNEAIFEVKDDGPGIEESEIEKIWERYYRGTDSHKRAIVGTGLGLSIVKTILDNHKYEYGVKSSLGYGSNFFFKAHAIREDEKYDDVRAFENE